MRKAWRFDSAATSMSLFSIGHSNRSIDEFVALLQWHGIKELVVRGLTTGHIVSSTRCNPHILTSFARVEDGRVTYPGEC